MYLNISKRIKNTVDTRDARHLNMVGSKIPCFNTQDTHLGAGTPEYKLESGFCAHKPHTFSCTGGIL